MTRKTIWKQEFERLKNKTVFADFYREREDQWLQYSDWDKKIPAIFGSCKEAILQFKATRVASRKS